MCSDEEVSAGGCDNARLCFCGSPLHSADWTIDNPVHGEVFDTGSNIAGNGTGEANAEFVIKVKKGSITKKVLEDTVGPQENWSNIIDPPAPGVWTTESGNSDFSYQLWVGGSWQNLRSIVINKEGEV